MKTEEKTPALREIMERALYVPKPRVWCGEKLPTEKQLRESGAPVLAEADTATGKIVAYANGYFSYRSGRRWTVQRIHACVDGITYVFADGQRQFLGLEVFADLPFTTWMTLEGERRLEENRSDCEKKRALPYGQRSFPDERCDNEFDAILNRIALNEALACLTSRQRQIVTADFLEKKSQRQIAQTLRISQQAAHARLQAALRKLRRYLRENFPEKNFSNRL